MERKNYDISLSIEVRYSPLWNPNYSFGIEHKTETATRNQGLPREEMLKATEIFSNIEREIVEVIEKYRPKLDSLSQIPEVS